MANKKFKKKELQEKAEEFIKAEKINKTILTLDWMDSYVAKLFPEKIEEYAKKCATFETKADGKDSKKRIDIKSIREYFIQEFFPSLTDEAIAARKAAKKAEEEAKKAKAETLTPEQQIAKKLKELAEEDED